jgi:hypothetical protein
MPPVPDKMRDKAHVGPTTAGAMPAFDGAARFSRAGEALRMLLAAAAGLFAFKCLLHDGIFGGSDATWYTSVVADHLEQWRAGYGPVFVGQTRFASIGTVIPLRVAPYLQHLTLALDFATGRTLSPYLLLNLAVALSGAAGGLSAYLCLRSILPSKRLEALLLAVLYIWCPGVFGLPYSGQLFMSAMTLPYIPIVFAGIVRIFRRDDFSGWAMVSAGCAGCWLGHSPIGIWVSISALLALGARWGCGRGWNRGECLHVLGAGLLFAGLCGYVFVSVATLASPSQASAARVDLLAIVRDGFPRILLPVSHHAELTTDLQPGWTLLAALLAAGALAWTVRSLAARILSLIGLWLLCLLVPLPFLNAWLWQRVPQAVIDATNAVPNQRLVAILAACVVTLAATVLAAGSFRRRWTLLGLAIGVAWSGYQLREFFYRGHLLINSRALSEQALKADNLVMTRFSLGMLSYENTFFSNGFTDLGLEQRVADPDWKGYIVSDVAVVAPGFDFASPAGQRRLPKAFTGKTRPSDHVWVNISPKLTIFPGKHYLLALDFPDADRKGVLQLVGEGFYREYHLPVSGSLYSFGTTALSSKVLPLSTDSNAPVELALAFTNEDPDIDMAHFGNFARYDLIEYDPGALPIRLKSLLPYVAEAESPSAGWFESFRYYTPGWTATVNGRPVEVRRSPNGLVAVPVDAGRSEVRLAYRAPLPLVLSYWLTWACWAGLAVFAARGLWRGSFSWAGPGSGPTLRSP